MSGRLNDISILAWTDFQVEGRSTLHESVASRIAALQQACEIENVTSLKKE